MDDDDASYGGGGDTPSAAQLMEPQRQQQQELINQQPGPNEIVSRDRAFDFVGALPPEILVEFIEYMLSAGHEADVIALCGSSRETRRICQEVVIDVGRLRDPLPPGEYTLIEAARTLAFRSRRCVLWAWLLATQNVLDAYARRAYYTPARTERVGQRRARLVQGTKFDDIAHNDLLLWATNNSPRTMPPVAQYVLGNDRARPYLWRQLIKYAYGAPSGDTPFGMDLTLSANPSDPQSTLVPIDGDTNRAPPPLWATLLDSVQVPDAVGLGLVPADFSRLPLADRQALVARPEYAAIARGRIIEALSEALRGTPLEESNCARRLFDLFDVRVFVAPGTLRIDHYASIRLRPSDISPYDPIDYWSTGPN
jgi:hypothetical protein